MGQITRSFRFTGTPSETDWNVDVDALFSLVNGSIDSTNVTTSGASGISVLATAQTYSARKTFSAGIVLDELVSVAAAGAGLVKLADFRYDPASGTSTDLDGFYIDLTGDDDAATPNETIYGRFGVRFTDTGDASEDGELFWGVMTAGSLATELWLSGAALYPNANDGLALGVSGTAFSDLFLASGAVINFNAGDVTITHAANALALAGASSGYTVDAVLSPATNDAAALGTTSLGWSDLHLATGGVINWANGEVTITETDANTLTIAGVATRVDLAAGILEMNNAIEWDTGVAVVAAEYSIGRDADATNQLHLNVPTGASYELSVNDVATLTLSATTLTLGSAVTTVALPSGTAFSWNSGDVTETHAANTLTWAGAASGYVFNGGNIYLNDTSNAKMTLGLTLNQGANDDEIFALKSSDVSHGVTSTTEDDTYGFFKKLSASNGGLFTVGLTAASDGHAVYLQGIAGGASTTHSAAGKGIVQISTAVKSGTGQASAAANGNLLCVDDNGSVRFIVDVEGDLFADGSAPTIYDTHDDVALVSAFDYMSHREGAKGLVETEWEDFTKYNEQQLIELDILGGPRVGVDPSKRGLINYTGLARLHNGAIRQLGRALNQQKAQITALEGKLMQLAERN